MKARQTHEQTDRHIHTDKVCWSHSPQTVIKNAHFYGLFEGPTIGAIALCCAMRLTSILSDFCDFADHNSPSAK